MRSVPPLDPTTAPSVSAIPLRPSSVSGLRPAARPPILASECLKDDLAPIEPHGAAVRVAIAASGAIVVAAGAAHAATSPLAGGVVAASGALLASASALRSYRVRAIASLGAGALSVAAASHALASSGAFGAQLPLIVLRALAPALLAAVLLLRATYRAHATTRVMLGPAILLFFCAALFAGGVPPWAPALSLLPRVACGAMGIVGLLALLGYMSEQTTAGCAAWSALALFTGAGAIVLDGASPLSKVWVAGALGVSAAMVGLATALFASVASQVGPRERERGDVRQSVPSEPDTLA